MAHNFSGVLSCVRMGCTVCCDKHLVDDVTISEVMGTDGSVNRGFYYMTKMQCVWFGLLKRDTFGRTEYLVCKLD